MSRYICIHGHFYQPPRENPWLEAIELQDSAAPYHDWNERITEECYRPNGWARVVDASARSRKSRIWLPANHSGTATTNAVYLSSIGGVTSPKTTETAPANPSTTASDTAVERWWAPSE